MEIERRHPATRIRRFVVYLGIVCAASAQTKEAHLEIQLGTDSISSLQATDDGRLLLSQGSRNACLWLIPAGKELRCFNGANTSALNPDGRAMIYSDGKSASVIEPRSGSQLTTIAPQESQIVSVAISD